MTLPQTLAHGSTPQQKYAGLGGHTGRVLAPISRALAFWFGLPGSGKSYLLQSIPDSYTFNLDNSDSVTPWPHTIMWPGKNPVTGQSLGDDGNPVIITHEHIMAKVQLLKQMAAENRPRPSTIIFDSLSSWNQILRDYILRNAVSIGLSKTAVTDLNQLHGPSWYGYLYDTIVKTVSELKSCGYGVHLVGHVVREKTPIGPDQYIQTMEFTMGDGLWKRLFPLLEVSLYVGSVEEPVKVEKVREVGVRGEVKKETYTVSTNERRWYAEGMRAGLEGMVKTRVPVNRILLPRENTWAAFEKAYQEASNEQSK